MKRLKNHAPPTAASAALIVAAALFVGCREPESVIAAREVNAIVFDLRDRVSNPKAVDEAAASLAPRGALASHHLLDVLCDRDADVRRAAAALLGRAGYAPAVPSLTGTLKDPDPRVRAEAADALRRIRDARAIEPLAARLKDSMPDVRIEAARALGAIADVRSMDPLLAAVTEEYPPSVRKAVAEALQALREAHGPDLFFEAMAGTDPLACQGAALMLSAIDDPRADDALLKALGNEAPGVRATAAWALGKRGTKGAVEPLLAALEEKVPEVRGSAAAALGILGDPRAVPPLMARMADGNRRVERAVMQALVDLGEPAVEPLIKCLGSRDAEIRLKAVWALGRINDPRAIRPLIDRIKDSDSRVVRWAGDSLVKITGYQREPVLEYWEKWWQENKDRFQTDKAPTGQARPSAG